MNQARMERADEKDTAGYKSKTSDRLVVRLSGKELSIGSVRVS